MAQQEIEVILTRQLASYLSMPIFIVDPGGMLLFFNEPAETLLGRRFDETGALPASELAAIFVTTDEAGAPIPSEELPLLVALAEGRPLHRRLRIRGLDGAIRHLEITAFPLIGMAGRHLGAVAMFWEAPAP